MKIINRKKFIARMLDLIVLILTITLTPKAIDYANAWRGYKGFGGEYLIPVLGMLLILVIETIYEETKNSKKK